MKAPSSGTCKVCGNRYRKGSDITFLRPPFRHEPDSPWERTAHRTCAAKVERWRQTCLVAGCDLVVWGEAGRCRRHGEDRRRSGLPVGDACGVKRGVGQAGYKRHLRAGERACEDCLRAAAAYKRG